MGDSMTVHLDTTLEQVLSVLARVGFAVNTALANSASVIAAQRSELEASRIAQRQAEGRLQAFVVEMQKELSKQNKKKKLLYDWRVPDVHASKAAHIRANAAKKDLARLSALHRTTVLQHLRAASPVHSPMLHEDDHDEFLRQAEATLAGVGPAVVDEVTASPFPPPTSIVVDIESREIAVTPALPVRGMADVDADVVQGNSRGDADRVSDNDRIRAAMEASETEKSEREEEEENERPLTVARLELVARERSRHVPALKLAALMAQYIVKHRFAKLIVDVSDDVGQDDDAFKLRSTFAKPSRKKVCGVITPSSCCAFPCPPRQILCCGRAHDRLSYMRLFGCRFLHDWRNLRLHGQVSGSNDCSVYAMWSWSSRGTRPWVRRQPLPSLRALSERWQAAG
jgi:hypothetical protein